MPTMDSEWRREYTPPQSIVPGTRPRQEKTNSRSSLQSRSAFSERWSMPKRTLAMVLAVLLSVGPACYSRKVQKVATVDVPQPKNERIVGVTTIKGEDVSFDPPGASIKNGTLSASVKKTPYEVPLDQ